MRHLSEQQKTAFERDGYLVIEEAVTPKLLDLLREDMAAWIEESRSQSQNYGETVNGKPRFDLDPSHGPDHPALRRVNAPLEVSLAYFEAASEAYQVDAVAELIGPDLRFHHAKINAKQPGSVTAVGFHQDFCFTPHSNDDLVTSLLAVDEMTAENGALEVVPGSHRGPLHSLWHAGRFTGQVSEEVAAEARRAAVTVTAPAGGACLMHTRLLHGSAANRTQSPRTLFISVYAAADARPLSPNPMPSRYEGMLLRGVDRGRVRSQTFEMELPELPSGASFFEQQAAAEKEPAA
ncbi:MAG: phytanoyl-CoA dioxygenase family protein [Limibacillus sp.]|jgi:ectoine hydroxylase-related dioxygenase (phytanoyl-CoA dioxygenase family)